MIKLEVFNPNGAASSAMDFDETVFGTVVKKRLMREVVLMIENNQRQGNANTKTRAERQGSGKKPWRQKGTGRARSGSIRSPLWRGGGTSFGPRTRDYYYTMPQKAKLEALRSALLGKMRDGEVKIVEAFQFDKPKTKQMAAMLKSINVLGSSLLVVPEYNETVWKSTRNLYRTLMSSVNELNTWDVLRHKHLVITKQALELLKERLGK
jgi:large subunit ribosomal protein L4